MNTEFISSISEDGTTELLLPKNRKFHDTPPEMNIFLSKDEEINGLEAFREDIKIPGSRTFLIHNFLSKEECQFLINETNKNGYTSIEKEFPKEYRNNTRYVGRNSQLSKTLYKRMQKFFQNDDLESIKPYGFDQHGIWIPLGLADTFIFSKYEQGGKFKPHYDSTYVHSPNQRSIYTIQIYLNEDFQGGKTNFYNKTNINNPLDSSSNNLNLLETVTPKQGSALIFNHDVLHEGCEVLKGTKYILRVYMMFLRIDNNHEINHQQRIEIDNAINLFFEADTAEKDLKDTTLAIKLYIEAQMTLLKYPSIITTSNSNYHSLENFPEILLFELLKKFQLPDIGSFLCLNKYLNNILKKNQLWRSLYIRDFSYESFQIQGIEQDLVLNSWYLTYKTINSKKHKQYILLDFGSEFIKYCDQTGEPHILPQRGFLQRFFSPHHVIADFDKVHWVIGEKSDYPNFYVTVVDGELIPENGELLYELIYHIMMRGFKKKKLSGIPTNIAASPKNFIKPNWKQNLNDGNHYRLPLYYFNAGLLALQSHGKISGTVVMLGYGQSIVVPFIRGVQLDRIYEFPINGNSLKQYIFRKHKEFGINKENFVVPIGKKHWYKYVTVSNDYKESMGYQSKVLSYSPEIYFTPKLHDSSIKEGLVEQTFNLINSYKPAVDVVSPTNTNLSMEDFQLLQNVIITGGISMIENFVERFSRQLKDIDQQLNIIYSHDRFNDIINGGYINDKVSKPYHDIYQPPKILPIKMF